jgi:hypothetical protein
VAHGLRHVGLVVFLLGVSGALVAGNPNVAEKRREK